MNRKEILFGVAIAAALGVVIVSASVLALPYIPEIVIPSLHTTTSTSSSTIATSLTSTMTGPNITVPLVASSTNNACFVNTYNDSLAVDNGILYSCSANLTGNQSIKQNIFRSFELYGDYSIAVNASQPISILIVEGGAVVYANSGSTISYRGTVEEDETMSITVTNLEATGTPYEVTIDFRNVTV